MFDIDVEYLTSIAGVIADETCYRLLKDRAIAESVDRRLAYRKAILDIREDHRSHLGIEPVHPVGIGGESDRLGFHSSHAKGLSAGPRATFAPRGLARRQSTCQRAPQPRW